MKAVTELITAIHEAESAEVLSKIGNYIVVNKKNYCLIDLRYMLAVHQARFDWIIRMEECKGEDIIQQAKDLLNP